MGHEELTGVLPLLAPVLGLEGQGAAPASHAPLTSPTVPEHTLLTDLLLLALGDAVLQLDDVQWCDDASMRVLYRMAAHDGGSGGGGGGVGAVRPSRALRIMVLASRACASSGHARRLLTLPHSTVSELAPLSNEDVVQLACNVLEVDAIPLELTTLLQQRGQGNPLFCKLLLAHLQHQGYIETGGGGAASPVLEPPPPHTVAANASALPRAPQLPEPHVRAPPRGSDAWRPQAPGAMPRFRRSTPAVPPSLLEEGGGDAGAESAEGLLAGALRRSISGMQVAGGVPGALDSALSSHGHLGRLAPRECRVVSQVALAEMTLPEAVRELLLHNFDQLGTGWEWEGKDRRGTCDRVAEG